MGLTFAGHETFTCKNYWLKKGLDHAWKGGTFKNEAILDLGVGKNMVGAIRYWVRSFGLIEFSDEYNDLAKYIFATRGGKDPYLEDIGTIWLLHFLLVSTQKASIYSLVFSYFRKLRVEFNREQLLAFLETECQTNNIRYSVNSLKKDIAVFINNYITPNNAKTIENDFFGLLYELNLVDKVRKDGALQTYKIENRYRATLPSKIVLASVLLTQKSSSVTFEELLNGINSVGSIYAINSNNLMACIDEMCQAYPKHIVYSDDAGVQVLQIRDGLNLFDVLNDYYGK